MFRPMRLSFTLFWILTSGIFSQGISQNNVLDKSIAHHDPENNWTKTTISIHIQEPRPQTPLRYSELTLDLGSGTFDLTRAYEPGIVSRIISETGEPTILLNGSADIDEEIVEEFRLDPSRNSGYRGFYKMMIGLPMSLQDEIVSEVVEMGSGMFHGIEVHVVRAKLNESLISDEWEVYFSKEDFSLKGLQFIHDDPESEDELIVFDGSFSWDGITIPRFRHWYLADSEEYLGTDVIVKPLD
jgi:hypothetical protein